MAKRISELPTAVNADGMMLTGTQGGITKQIPAHKVGGGDWDDITSLFTVDSSANNYTLSEENEDSLIELIMGIPLRITIELFGLYEFDGVHGNVSGTIQLYVTRTTASVVQTILQTNTIESVDGELTGTLNIGNDRMYYSYGVSIPDGLERPKILKVERLMEV